MARPKIGLVLGGGGSRGLAHVGVLQVLERERIPIDIIVGTSMGGIVGLLYALGHPPADMGVEIQKIQGNSLSVKEFGDRLRQQTTPADVAIGTGLGGMLGMALVAIGSFLRRRRGLELLHRIDPLLGASLGGLVGGMFILARGLSFRNPGVTRKKKMSPLLTARVRQRRVRHNLSEELAGKTFADLNIPVSLLAVDMRRGEEVVLNKGPLLPAILASCAVPGAFPPVKYEDMELADGGVIDSLATHVAFEQGAERVIAVDIYPALDEENPWVDPLTAIMGLDLPANIFSTSGSGDNRIPTAAASMWRSIRVITWHLHQKRLQAHPPDVLIRPAVESYGSLDFKDLAGPLQAGVEAAEFHLAELRALVRE